MNAFTDGVMQVATKAFEQCSSGTNLFVLPLFLVRVAYANSVGGNPGEYTQAVKGVVLYFILIFGFAPILQILLSLPEAFLPGFQFDVFNQARPDAAGEMSTLSAVPSVLLWSLESIVACLFYLALFLNFAFTIVLSSIAPIVFLLAALLGIGFGLRTFFGLLIVVSSWPIVWAACDQLSALMIPVAGGELGGVVFEVAVTLLKIAGPLAVAYFGLSSAPGQGVATAIMTSAVTGNVLSGVGHGFIQGAKGSEFRHEPRPLRGGPGALTQRLAHGVGTKARSVTQQARGIVGQRPGGTTTQSRELRAEGERRGQESSSKGTRSAAAEKGGVSEVHSSESRTSQSANLERRSSNAQGTNSMTASRATEQTRSRDSSSSVASAAGTSTENKSVTEKQSADRGHSRDKRTQTSRGPDARSSARFQTRREDPEKNEES